MAYQKYAQLTLIIEGKIQYEVKEVSISLNMEKTAIHTLKKKLAGWNSGPGLVEITFQSAIPASGVEFNFWNAALNTDTTYEVELVGLDGGKSYIGNGVFKTPGYTQSAGGEVSGSITFEGEPNAIQ